MIQICYVVSCVDGLFDTPTLPRHHTSTHTPSSSTCSPPPPLLILLIQLERQSLWSLMMSVWEGLFSLLFAASKTRHSKASIRNDLIIATAHNLSVSRPPLSLPFTDTRIHTLLSFCVTFARGSGLAPLSLEHSRTNHWSPVLALHTRGACGAWIRHQGSELENQPCSLFLPPPPPPQSWKTSQTQPLRSEPSVRLFGNCTLLFDVWQLRERGESRRVRGCWSGWRGAGAAPFIRRVLS